MGWRKHLWARRTGQEASARAAAGSRAAVTVHVDVAACIRWFGIGLALVLLSWSLSGEQAASVLRSAIERHSSFLSSRATTEGAENRTLPVPATTRGDIVNDTASRESAV